MERIHSYVFIFGIVTFVFYISRRRRVNTRKFVHEQDILCISFMHFPVSYNVTVIIIINEKKMVHYLKGIDKKDIGLCTEQIIASISLAY